MKTIQTEKPIGAADYAAYLRERLNPLFQKQRLEFIDFRISLTGNDIEIIQPELYDGFLFRMEFSDSEIRVIKSEHYTDDVNVLTLEDILNNLFMEFPGRDNIELIKDRS